MMAKGPVSPTLLERYELKYPIPFSLVQPISDYVSRFCDLDYYSEISPDGFYVINSLYFDTPSLYFLRMKENLTERFSLRVRSYSDHPKAPYFFEVKEKIGDFSKKRRGVVPFENWQDVFLNPARLGSFQPEQDSHLRHFLNLARSYNAQPMILTQYRRKAYLSRIDDYARVTFDRSLRYQAVSDYTVHPDESRMLNYDHPDSFGDPGKNVILEIKCERKVPMWIVDLIQHFQLVRQGFSKFENSMLEAYSQRRWEEFAGGRIPTPHSWA